MAAHWVVLAAAALTALVAAAAGAALAVFAGVGLPQAVRHELVNAPGNSLTAAGPFSASDARTTATALRSAITRALPGVPVQFWSATWSDPLGFAGGALPAKPAGAAGGTPLLEAVAPDDITGHAVLVAGHWPAGPGTGPDGAIPAALPATTAALLRLHPGDVLRVQDRNTSAPLSFAVTGLYARRQAPGDTGSYWQLDTLPASGSSTVSGFTTYGPLVVAPAAFASRLTAASGSWVAQPDMSAVTDTELSALSGRVTALQASLSTSGTLGSVQLASGLPGLLADVGSNVALARALLAISGLQLLVLGVAALLAAARLLAAQREGETALLTARGATRWQLTRLTAAEVMPLAAVSALAGGVAGIFLARLLGGTLYGTGDGGISVTATATWTDALAAAVVVAAVAACALLYPVLRPAGGTRVRRGRQAALAGASRAGADLALIALAVLAGWQLRRYSAVSTSATGAPAAIDPVLALAPALALAGGTVLTLRLLPAAARLADRLAAGGRGLVPALAGWQFSRQPLRQGGAALLIVMAVATGTLALAQHQSWLRSASDQAGFTAGADVRVDVGSPLPPAATATVTRAAGVTGAMAVAVDTSVTPAPVTAVDAAQAAPVVRLRGDQSTLPPARLFAALAAPPPAGGTALAGRPSSIRLTATLSAAPLGQLAGVLTVTDATGGTFQLPLPGGLRADGRPHPLTVALGGSGLAYPLRIGQLTVSYTMPEQPYVQPVTLTVTGASLAGWQATASSSEADLTQHPAGPYAIPGGARLAGVAGGAAVTFDSGYGKTGGKNALGQPVISPVNGQVTLTAPHLAPATVPAIATQAFDTANHAGVGQVVAVSLSGITFPVRIAAQVTSFPTVSGSGLVVDLRTLQSLLVARGGSPLGITQWWLATAGGRVPAGLAAALPPGAGVTSSATLTAATEHDPLSAAPQQALLAVAAAAALLAITGCCVTIAANVRQRKAESALLAALGVRQRSAAAQLLLEKLLLSVPSAAVGLLLGTVVARLLVPAVTLSPTARSPVPAAIALFDLSQTLPLAAVIAVLPALAGALVVFRRPDPAAELRAAEAA